ncbi:RagB/SusD family nutrient uptake outer membrane protein [Sinomicrobium soli]|nr:RagB/SusD family nutrient uptake outer membrane protein [Sinomicrobium sp. N-1-3-6]
MTTSVLAMLTLFLNSGCDHELDLLDPNNQPANEDYWTGAEQAHKGVNAIYNSLITDGYYMRMTPALTDGRGDDFNGDSPWLDLVQVANFTILPTAGPVEWMWTSYYQQVFRANQVLKFVPEIEMDQEEQDRCLGQAYFLRGLAYFHLVTNFEKVPVFTTVPQTPEDYYPPTVSTEEVWEQVISDFSAAQELLPVDYASVSGPDQGQKGRATKGAATGFLGKAYLYTRQWEPAIQEFEKLISGEQAVYSLMPDYTDNFSPFSENNAESLFEVQFASQEQVGGTEWNYGGEPGSNWTQYSSVGHTYAMDGFGYSDFLPTRWIYDEFKQELTADGRLDPRLLVTIASYEPSENSTTVYSGQPWPHAEDRIYPRKYTHDQNGWGFSTESNGGVEQSEINYRLLRYADILLMYAEALNESGETARAYTYIQMVRDRADLPDLAVARPDMTTEEMRDQIAHERALEFAIESIRIHDIIRWGWLYDAGKLAELKQHDPDFNTWTAGKEFLPIPQRELDVNPNLQPNSAN